ncbi:MAG: [FeFe] hydrogenase H-cluster maturation GTPase HydF [Clostridium sp.]|nr:[FeFe] hydrogenase H-cluster maturation GTPase HydF [Clostridium sp.]MDY5001622.1 [FeFe] hydrogenase H-cluster maturation GTPase HydF [Eubacteriales bacterium]MDY5756620.1 [FeFe] hydrogenase H-cluster maturation GTPase HydF [Eubacteriales bacterium]
MSLNDMVSAERLHISFFGMRNAGKSSLVNAVTGQQLAVVSEVKGTTTDPVKKAMELLPLGPVVIIDTPGLDDEGELGRLRVQKAMQVLSSTDIAVLVVDAAIGLRELDRSLVACFRERKIPYITVYNKADLVCERQPLEKHEIYASAVTGENIYALKEKLGAFAKQLQNPKHMVADLLSEGDVVVLVTPIDESAPKGRLILPQQMAVREVLDAHAVAITCQDTELPRTLESLAVRPKMVITDSQAFERVSADTPVDIPLTSFSILMARYKGDLPTLAAGASALSHLKDGDKVLISEGCTHHRQCNDIGTVKMPAWIERFCKAKPEFTFTSGGEFPEDLSPYSLIVHCGGCMLTETAMKHRIETAISAGVPIVNYGIAIAQMHGILKRSVQMFPDILALLD